MFAKSARSLAKEVVFLAATIVTLGVAETSLAQGGGQSQTNDRLLACNAIADPAEKLACFDVVVADIDQNVSEPTAVSDSVTPAESAPDSANTAAVIPTAAAGATASATPSTSPGSGSSSAATAGQPVTEVHESGTTATAAATASAVPAALPDTKPDENPAITEDDFGRESMKVDTDETEEVEELKSSGHMDATIVEMWPTIDGHFEVRLDNGQVWRETDRTRVRKPKVGSKVRISTGTLGSFRMKVGNNNRQAGVRRTK